MKPERSKSLAKILIYIILCLSISALIYSCKKDQKAVDAHYSTNIDAVKLQLWFEQNGVILESKDNWLNTLEPNWSNISRSGNEQQYIYEIDFVNPERIFAAAGNVDVKNVKTFENRSLLKLIIFENRTDQKLNAAIIELIGFEDNRVELQNLHYKNYEGFTGAVNFYELNGKLSNGWLYKEGKIIASTDNSQDLSKVALNDGIVSAKDKVMLAAAAPIECGSRSVPHWRQNCVTIGSVDGWGYSGGDQTTVCTWEVYHTTEIIYCPNYEDGGGGSGGGYTGGGSGGTGGGNTNDPPADDPCAKAKALNENTNYKDETANLKNKVDDDNLKKEVGYIKKVGNPSTYKEPSGSGLIFEIPQLNELADHSLEYIMHTHYNDSTALSTFSYADFIAFVEYLASPKVANVNTFNIGVTTKYGSYSLVLKNWNKFSSFLQNTIRSLDPAILFYQNFTSSSTGVHESNSGSVNEANLLKILKDSGISLIKKDPTTGSFKVLEIDSNGNVTIVDCPSLPSIE